MRKTSCFLLLLFCINTFAKIKVVTSIPDLADMVKEIGGEKIEVISLATGKEDLHAVPVKPSFLPILNKADLLITLGLDAEHSWLPSLVNDARNPKILKGNSGWIEVHQGISILDIPQIIDRSEGEQHPLGNPHYNIGPQCGKIMAKNICDALCQLSPENKNFFEQRAKNYIFTIDSITNLLKERGNILKGINVISYHPDISYLCEFYGMKIVGYIEAKAGIPPTTKHLKGLESKGREKNVKIVIYNQSQSPKIPQKLAKNINCKAVEIANAVGAKKEIDSWLKLQEYNLNVLVKAVEGEIK